MNRRTSIIAVAGLFTAGALDAQEGAARGPARVWQFSVAAGGGTGTSGVEVGPTRISDANRVSNVRVDVGWAVSERAVVGFDLFWSSLNRDVTAPYVPIVDNAIASTGITAQFYPLRRGFFVAAGAGFGVASINGGRYGPYSGSTSSQGVTFRYGAGFDIPVNPDWSLTAYVGGLAMPRPSSSWQEAGCAGCVSAPLPPGSTPPPAPPPLTTAGVSVLQMSLGLTYAWRTAPLQARAR